MRIAAGVAALLAAAVLASVAPAEGGQREELQRRREVLRQRQEELRRARVEARRGPMATEPFTALAKIGRQGTLTIVNPAGNVTLTGSGGNDVRIDAVKRAWGRTDTGARSALSDVEIEVTEREGAVDVRTRLQRQRPLDAEVDFTIAAVRRQRVRIRRSGDVTVSGVRGELRVETVGGNIKATSVGQVRLLRTLSGAVSLETPTAATSPCPRWAEP